MYATKSSQILKLCPIDGFNLEHGFEDFRQFLISFCFIVIVFI